MDLVDRAGRLARTARATQWRKGGAGVPYVTHLESVVAILRKHGYTDEVDLAAAWFHDVVDDTDWTLDRLADEGFLPAVIRALDTHAFERVQRCHRARVKLLAALG